MPTIARSTPIFMFVVAAAAAGTAALVAVPLRAAPQPPAGSAPAAAAVPLVALVSPSGEITVRRASDERVIATIRPGLFEQTWQIRGVSPSGAFSAPNPGGAIVQTVGAIRATSANAVVRVEASVDASEKRGNISRLRLRYTLTPDKPVAVNSLHISINTPATLWTGGGRFTRSDGTPPGTGGPVPDAAGTTAALFSAADARRFSLNKGANGRIYVETDAPTPLLLQDNRAFGSGDLEIRLGQQAERTVAAGQPETIAFTLEFFGPIKIQRAEPVTLAAGPDWVPLDMKQDIAPGSALDFSRLGLARGGAANRREPGGGAPLAAGAYGRVIVRLDGHFGFERDPLGRPVRFYGANLAFSANFPDHALADRLAERLQRTGYNSVRIHHYESELIDAEAPNSTTLRADSLDRLDYLVAALKKRGIYLTTDLFVSRPVKQTELDTEAGMDEFKAAVLVSGRAMDNWKAFSRALLTHVNPYTGTAYKDEPALALICVVNEPNATNYLGRLTGNLRARYEAEWQTFVKSRVAQGSPGWNVATKTVAPLPKSADSATPLGRETGAFLATLHERAFVKMRHFLRNEIGTKALLTDLNGWSETPAFMAARTQLDYVDNHFYWDHPQFLEKEWSLPSQGGSGGASALLAGGAGPSAVAMTRLLGKPFTVTEFNYSSPNPYRAEGGLLMGAAAALQGWDGVWRFAYSHSRDALAAPQPLNYFDMAVDPAGQASERAALLLFLRGDLKTAPSALTIVRNRATLMDKPQHAETDSGVPKVASIVRLEDFTLGTKVGVQVDTTNQQIASGDLFRVRGPLAQPMASFTVKTRSGPLTQTEVEQLNPWLALRTGSVRKSETGELFLDTDAGLLQINTERTVGGAAPAGQTITAGPLSATVDGARAVLWASSLDGRPVGQSRRLLLVHVSDVQMTNMRYAAPDRRVLLDWGTLPHLARAGRARVTLTHANAAKLQAWRLDTAGNRVAPLPVRVTNNGKQAVLDLATRGADGRATLYYEVVVRP